jgi:hypothetical protein
VRRLAKTSACVPGWCRITLVRLTPRTSRSGSTAHTLRAPAIVATPQHPETPLADNVRSAQRRTERRRSLASLTIRDPGRLEGCAAETTAPNRQASVFPFGTPTARTTRTRLTLSADRSFHLPPTAVKPQCPAGGIPASLARAPKSAATWRHRRDEPPQAAHWLASTLSGDRFLAEAAQRQPDARPIGSGPDRTVAFGATCHPAAIVRLAKGRSSLHRLPGQALAHPSGHTMRTVTRPLGRPAFRQGRQRSSPFTGRSAPPPSQRKQQLHRLMSRPPPTPAAAIAHQQILGNRQVGIVSFPPCRPPLRPVPQH